MGILPWFTENWPNFLGTVFAGAGLWYNGYSTRQETKARRADNVFTATARHWEIWSDFNHHPEYWRVKQASVDLVKEPITIPEEGFTTFVILHLGASFEAAKLGMLIEPEALNRDVSSFFSYPIPAAVWEKLKVFQNADFVKFVERCRSGKQSGLRFLLQQFFARSRKAFGYVASTFRASRRG